MIQYSEEFKEEAVKIAQQSNQPYSHTAKDLGVKPNTLYNWLSHHSSPIATNSDIETMKLRKENKRLKQELEILKKASAYFAKNLK